jgi:hypothetical protein
VAFCYSPFGFLIGFGSSCEASRKNLCRLFSRSGLMMLLQRSRARKGCWHTPRERGAWSRLSWPCCTRAAFMARCCRLQGQLLVFTFLPLPVPVCGKPVPLLWHQPGNAVHSERILSNIKMKGTQQPCSCTLLGFYVRDTSCGSALMPRRHGCLVTRLVTRNTHTRSHAGCLSARHLVRVSETTPRHKNYSAASDPLLLLSLFSTTRCTFSA